MLTQPLVLVVRDEQQLQQLALKLSLVKGDAEVEVLLNSGAQQEIRRVMAGFLLMKGHRKTLIILR